MMTLIEQWLTNKIYHKENADYIIHNLKAKTLAIYGAGRMGELIYDDLVENSALKIKYFIDKNADFLYYGIDDMEILNLDEIKEAEAVDVIIVTPYTQFKIIKNELETILNFKSKIVSLEEIIYKTE